MKIVMFTLLIINVVVFVMALVSCAKEEARLHNEMRIIYAIHDHNMDCIDNGTEEKMIPMSVIDSERDAWNYENMVPDWVLDRIKPYIERRRANEKHKNNIRYR